MRLFDPEAKQLPDGYNNYDVAPDGKRFLVLTGVEGEETQTGEVTLVQGWRALLE